MATVNIFILMDLNTWDNGKMTYNMEMVQKPGEMDLNMRVNIVKVRNMEKEYIIGMMEAHMKGIGIKI